MGKLNILRHKKWNVYNKANKERVEQDEKQHQLEQEKEQKRLQRHEQQRKLLQLRKGKEINKEEHFNLFSEREMEQMRFSDFEKQENLEKQKELVKIENQYTTWHLDKDAHKVPWYNQTEKKDSVEQDFAKKKKEDPFSQMPKSNTASLSSASSSKQATSASTKSIEQLRKERIQREQEEMQKLLMMKQKKSRPY